MTESYFFHVTTEFRIYTEYNLESFQAKGLLLAEQMAIGELLRLPGLGSSSHLCVLREEISITLVRGVPRGSTQSIYKQLKRGEGKKKVSYRTQHPALHS